MASWKRLALTSASFGAGFAVAMSLIVGSFVWYKSRPPKPWNSTAIKAQLVDVEMDARDPDNAVRNLVFTYVLENTTSFDYRLPEKPSVILMAKLRAEGSLLFDKDAKLDNHPLFIPAKWRVQYAIRVHCRCKPIEVQGSGVLYVSYDWDDADVKAHIRELVREGTLPRKDQIAALVSRNFPNLDGFVLFDQINRYEIEFPRGW